MMETHSESAEESLETVRKIDEVDARDRRRAYLIWWLLNMGFAVAWAGCFFQSVSFALVGGAIMVIPILWLKTYD